MIQEVEDESYAAPSPKHRREERLHWRSGYESETQMQTNWGKHLSAAKGVWETSTRCLLHAKPKEPSICQRQREKEKREREREREKKRAPN